MFFLQTARAPIIVTIGKEQLSIPKFTRGDFKAWGAELLAKNAESATAGMDEARKREWIAFYSSFGIDVGDFRKLVRTEEGSRRVCRTCLLRAEPKKTEADVDAILDANGIGVTASLAWALSDLDDASLYKAPPSDDEKSADPLTQSGGGDSTG